MQEQITVLWDALSEEKKKKGREKETRVIHRKRAEMIGYSL